MAVHTRPAKLQLTWLSSENVLFFCEKTFVLFIKILESIMTAGEIHGPTDAAMATYAKAAHEKMTKIASKINQTASMGLYTLKKGLKGRFLSQLWPATCLIFNKGYFCYVGAAFALCFLEP